MEDSELQDVPLETPEEDQGKNKDIAVQPSNVPPLDVPRGDTLENGTNLHADDKDTSGDHSRQPTVSSLKSTTVQSSQSHALEARSDSPPTSSVVERIMNHSTGDCLKQLAFLELLMADQAITVTDRDAVDAVLNAVSKKEKKVKVNNN